MRTITRTYKRKKTGELITKTYSYETKAKKNPVNKLTTKKGEYSKRGQQLLEKELDYATQDKIDWAYDILAKYKKQKKVLTLNQLRAMYDENRISIFLANMHISVDDVLADLLAQGIEIQKSWLLNAAHWTFHSDDDADILLPTSKVAYFTFNYIEHTYEIKIMGDNNEE